MGIVFVLEEQVHGVDVNDANTRSRAHKFLKAVHRVSANTPYRIVKFDILRKSTSREAVVQGNERTRWQRNVAHLIHRARLPCFVLVSKVVLSVKQVLAKNLEGVLWHIAGAEKFGKIPLGEPCLERVPNPSLEQLGVFPSMCA
mmetsp:Transcript_64738/g.156470  ORF Transcript_64738/g.156470 Transcript_64738/m.156470 type:complete len:144 (-) Transcript_64738:551-982(-)